MDVKRWQKIKSLFDAAQNLESDERRIFLEKACAGDEDLRREVGKLLESFESADSFMENPAAAEAGSLFEDKKTLIVNQTTGELPTENLVAGTILASRYRINGALGKGGMGEVYRAEDIKLSQTVALKFLPDKLEKDRDALNRFIGEVRTARAVSHANVCRVFDLGEIDAKHFISMEYVDGDDLSSLLRRVGRLPSERAIEISRQLCVGLHAIHDAGILHRDFKPANIIIDSKGRARITDFGIAGLETEISKENMRVGTPAYMSPEQMTGKDISPRSDIYALGLVLYEIFTGKQAFQADSIPDLIRKHQTETPTNPSEFVKGIDPLVEKVIFQCLEKNPANRPPSALHVALALPGGNPLQVALEAGKTPSPEMVAAAPKKGALKPKIALALLVLFFAAFISLSILHQDFKAYNAAPLEKSPEVLAEKAAAMLGKFGYANQPADTVYRFEADNSFMIYKAGTPQTVSQIKKMLGYGQPFEIYFLYRQSPRYLEPKSSGNVTEFDPPLTTEKMANIKLDVRGRLIEFVAVPPQISERAKKKEADWNALFTEAGLDISLFKPIESKQTPPVFADERRAWEGTLADLPEIPIRIEAAAFGGKPVYFRIIAPWNAPEDELQGGARQTTASTDESGLAQSAYYKTGVFAIIAIYCLVITGSIFLARRNLRAGRGDLRGALKLTLFLFLVYFTGHLIYADHVPTVWGEMSVIYQTFSSSLISALFVGLIYIALEPFVRRHWSELLISWNRLLAGDFRDPLIGRDLLCGGLLGIGHTVGIYLGSKFVVLLTTQGEVFNDAYNFRTINGFSGITSVAAYYLASAVLSGFILLFILLGLFMLLKRKNLSVFLIFFLIFSLQSLFFVLTQHWGFVFSAVFNAACFSIALSRFGLLGLISFWMCFYLSYLFPISFNTASLYFPSTIFAFIAAFSLAIYSFHISLAGQKIFETNFFKDIES